MDVESSIAIADLTQNTIKDGGFGPVRRLQGFDAAGPGLAVIIGGSISDDH
jgi:hypothetical protein